MSGAPHGALDVAGEVAEPALAALAHDDCGLGGVVLDGIGELGRVGDEAGDHGEDWAIDGRDGQAVFGARNPVRVREAAEYLVLFLDAGEIGIAERADDLAVLANAEDVGQSEIGAALVALGVKAGLEGGKERAAGIYIGAQLAALFVA